MGNSIFDDDDGGFSLSSGFDPGEKKTSPGKPSIAPPKAPSRANVSPSAPKQPSLPVQPQPIGHRLPTLPVAMPNPAPQTIQPSLPNQTSLPNQNGGGIPSRLPPMPSANKSFTQLPVSAPSYTDEAKEDTAYNVDGAYNQQVEEQRISDERAENERLEREREREREDQAHADRRRAREREEAHADRVRRDEENRAHERKLAEQENSYNYNQQESQPQQPIADLSKSNKKSGKKQKATKEKKPSSYAGGRRKILIIKIIAYLVVAVFLTAGVKTIFFPTPGPTPKQVVATVKKGLGLTAFPTEQGSGFVIGFSKVYFTIQANGSGERAKALAPYMPTAVIAEQKFNQSDGSQVKDPQTVTSGPYISGVVNKDNNNAVYTIATEVNNQTWLYADVPVYYDDKEDAFVISGTPAFVPAPDQGTLVGQPKSWSADDPEVTLVFTEQAKQFFPAWGKSDKSVMAPYITSDATTAVKAGLDDTMKFTNLNSVSVQPKDGLTDPSKRKARVAIQWESNIVKGTTYAQVYDLEIEKVADQWRIKSIVGGITTEGGK